MPVLSNLIVRIGASTDDFDKKVNASLNKIKRFGADVAQAGQALSIGISAPLALAGAAALKAASDMETLSKGLSATMKSTSAAADELQRLKEVAKLPGLNLEDAVKGSIRLQTLGNSAADSRRIMIELGNALAVVGGGREDFAEVIRQLTQLGAVGKVTKENLDPIVERIPQIAAIIKEKFGAAALGDPAKTFERLGISSQQFISIIVAELAKGDRAGGTFKNSLENLRDAATQTAAEFGKALLPVGQKVIDEFLNPGIERAKALADSFNGLSDSSKTAVIEMAAFAAALPVAILVLGTMAEKIAAIIQGIIKLRVAIAAIIGVVGAFGAALNAQVLAMAGVAAGTQAAAIAIGVFSAAATVAVASLGALAYAGYQWYDAQESLNRSGLNLSNTTEMLLKKLRGKTPAVAELEKQYRSGAIGLDEFNAKLLEIAKSLSAKGQVTGAATAATQSLTQASAAATGAIEQYRQIVVSSYEEDFKTAVLKERLSILQSDYTQRLNDGVAALVKYGSAAGAAAAALREMRIAEMPPDISSAIDIRKLPNPMGMPGLPGESVLTGADQARAAKRNADMIKILSRDAAGEWKKTQQAISRQVSTIVTDLSRGLADIIVSGGKVGEKFEELGKQIAKSLIRTVIENGINKVIAALGGLMANLGGVGGALGGLLGGTGARTATSAIPGVLGGGANAAMGAIPGISTAAGSASSGIGSAVAAANPVTAVVNAVAGVATAVSSIISNFQFAAMNKTLDLIEKEVRYSQIHLLHLLEKNNEYLPKLKDIWDSLIRMETRGMAVGGGGGAVTINISTTGDTRQLLDALTRELKLLGVIPQ
jgi:tape measure domain-containing protein